MLAGVPWGAAQETLLQGDWGDPAIRSSASALPFAGKARGGARKSGEGAQARAPPSLPSSKARARGRWRAAAPASSIPQHRGPGWGGRRGEAPLSSG